MADLIENTDPFLNNLNYGDLEDGDKALIDALITAASDMVELRCNRTFAATDYVDEPHNGDQVTSIWVDNLPINSVTNVKVICRGETSDQDQTTTYLASKLIWDADTGSILIRTQPRFPKGFKNVTVTYNGGFTTIPALIRKLVADTVIEAYDGFSDEQIEKEKIGDYFVQKGRDAIDKALLSKSAIINQYRIMKV